MHCCHRVRLSGAVAKTAYIGARLNVDVLGGGPRKDEIISGVLSLDDFSLQV